jgi:hypothetical protein
MGFTVQRLSKLAFVKVTEKYFKISVTSGFVGLQRSKATSYEKT